MMPHLIFVPFNYDESTDDFDVITRRSDNTGGLIHRFKVPAEVFAHMVGEFGEPAEFIDREFTLKRRPGA